MQIMMPNTGLMNMDYYQLAEAGQIAVASHDIVAVPMVEEAREWTEADGGTVLVAEGALELTAGPDVLDYPLGIAEEVMAAPVAIEHLPPYDVEPWVGFEEQTLAFHINPVGVEASEGIAFRVLGEDAPAGAVYDVWSVHDKKGVLELLGVAEDKREADAGAESDTAGG